MRKITINCSRIAAIGLFSMLLSGPAMAQDSIRITLEQALEIALSDNPTVKIADNEIKLKKYSKRETQAGLFPNISASGSHSYAVKIPTIALGDQTIQMGSKHTTAGSFNAQLPLIAPQLWKTIQLNSQDVNLALEQSRASKIDMENQVKQAFFSYLLAKDSYDALLAGYKNAELNAKIVTDKFRQELVSEYDKLVADVQLRNQQPQVMNGENAVKLSIMMLKVLLGFDINEPIIFDGDLSDYESEMLSNLTHLKSNLSLDENSQLRQIDINEKILKKSEQINKFGYLPTVGLGFSYGWQSMGPDLKVSDYTWYPNSALSLSVSIPIFDGGQKYYKTKQNRVSQINLQLQRDNVVRQLNTTVNNSLNTISTAVDQVESNKETVNQAQKALDISQKRYTIGSGTILDLNNQETALTVARLQYAQSIYDFLSAKSDLEATLGKTTVNP